MKVILKYKYVDPTDVTHPIKEGNVTATAVAPLMVIVDHVRATLMDSPYAVIQMHAATIDDHPPTPWERHAPNVPQFELLGFFERLADPNNGNKSLGCRNVDDPGDRVIGAGGITRLIVKSPVHLLKGAQKPVTIDASPQKPRVLDSLMCYMCGPVRHPVTAPLEIKLEHSPFLNPITEPNHTRQVRGRSVLETQQAER